MLKKTVLAVVALIFAVALMAPPKANAQVVGAGPVVHRPAYGYGYAAARPYPRAYVAPRWTPKSYPW